MDNRSNRSFLVHEIERLRQVIQEKEVEINMWKEKLQESKEGGSAKASKQVEKPARHAVDKAKEEEADT